MKLEMKNLSFDDFNVVSTKVRLVNSLFSVKKQLGLEEVPVAWIHVDSHDTQPQPDIILDKDVLAAVVDFMLNRELATLNRLGCDVSET